MKKLLLVANHAGFFLSHRLPIAIAAREHGWDVHVATPKSKHVPRIVELGLAWHELRLSRSDIRPLEELRTIADLARLYCGLRPDIVHHVTAKPVLYGTLVARLIGVPAVINAVSGLGILFADQSSPRLRLLQRLISIGYRVALRHPRMRVIFQNEELRDAFVANRWVEPGQAVLIAGAGVDMQVFAPKPRTEEGGATRVVLATRMLFPKGIAEFVEAARILRTRGANVRMILVGEPDPANPGSVSLETLQRWNDEGAVVYRGRSEEMPSVFAEADIVALPTYYGEGLPKVLIEAAACGLPIVTTDWPGCREVVHDGENGLLVPIRDAVRLADAIERLARNPELRRRMGARGRERAVAEWGLDSVVAQTLALYTEHA